MPSEYVRDVSAEDFEYEVIAYSKNIPVLVDFWAAWCHPCKILTPLLERLTIEAQGGFRLARLDVEANPNIALQFGVRSLPTVKAFSNGVVVAEFTGIVPEERLRDFLSKVTPPSPTTLALEKAEGLLDLHQWTSSEQLFRELLEKNPGSSPSLLGLAKTLLVQNKISEAHQILADFPDSRQLAHAELLRPLAEAMLKFNQNELPNEDDLDAAYQNVLRLIGKGNLFAAMDGLLDIMRVQKRYRDDLARKTFVAILELLGETEPQTRQYRQELASILY
jgi:putative thioredoxin